MVEKMKKKVVSFVILILIMLMATISYAATRTQDTTVHNAYRKIKNETEESISSKKAEELAEIRDAAYKVSNFCLGKNADDTVVDSNPQNQEVAYRVDEMKPKAEQVKTWVRNRDNQLRDQGEGTIDKIANTEKNKQTREITMPTWDDMKQQADNFASQDKNYITNDSLSTILMPIARMLVAFGSVVLVIVTIVMGIRYMTANPDDQAKLKQQLIGLVIATIVVLGAQGIWALVYNFMIEVTK